MPNKHFLLLSMLKKNCAAWYYFVKTMIHFLLFFDEQKVQSIYFKFCNNVKSKSILINVLSCWMKVLISKQKTKNSKHKKQSKTKKQKTNVLSLLSISFIKYYKILNILDTAKLQ